MKIAIIGTGNVGGTLGRSWARIGHEIIFCSRAPESEKVQELVRQTGAKVKSATLQEGVKEAQIVLIATPWAVTLETVEAAGSWNGKIIIDATNPLRPDLSGLMPLERSAGEEISARAPGAKVVKAFNTVPTATMENPLFGDVHADLLICGNDSEAKRVVRILAEELGFTVVDVGPLAMARQQENFASLWIYLAFMQGLGVNFAFKIIRR